MGQGWNARTLHSWFSSLTPHVASSRGLHEAAFPRVKQGNKYIPSEAPRGLWRHYNQPSGKWGQALQFKLHQLPFRCTFEFSPIRAKGQANLPEAERARWTAAKSYDPTGCERVRHGMEENGNADEKKGSWFSQYPQMFIFSPFKWHIQKKTRHQLH